MLNRVQITSLIILLNSLIVMIVIFAYVIISSSQVDTSNENRRSSISSTKLSTKMLYRGENLTTAYEKFVVNKSTFNTTVLSTVKVSNSKLESAKLTLSSLSEPKKKRLSKQQQKQRNRNVRARNKKRPVNRVRGLNRTELKLISEQSLRQLKSGDLRSRPIIITKASQIRKKKDWCRTEVLKQKITERGCQPKIIMNNYCYGQCNSFYIPTFFDEHENEALDDMPSVTVNGTKINGVAFKSCAFCKPKKVRYVSVRLNCPHRMPSHRIKKVLLIEKCRCLTEILQ